MKKLIFVAVSLISVSVTSFTKRKIAKYKSTITTLFILIYSCLNLIAQNTDTINELPFYISHIKKLNSLELAEKKQGTFITGIPDISSDPLNGFGYGVEGSITFNGKRSNPFFDYTPYLTKLDLALFNTSNQQRELIISIDKPYVFRSKWRIRGELGYESNPNLVYFGVTDNSLNTLGVISKQDAIPQPPFSGSN